MVRPISKVYPLGIRLSVEKSACGVFGQMPGSRTSVEAQRPTFPAVLLDTGK